MTSISLRATLFRRRGLWRGRAPGWEANIKKGGSHMSLSLLACPPRPRGRSADPPGAPGAPSYRVDRNHSPRPKTSRSPPGAFNLSLSSRARGRSADADPTGRRRPRGSPATAGPPRKHRVADPAVPSRSDSPTSRARTHQADRRSRHHDQDRSRLQDQDRDRGGRGWGWCHGWAGAGPAGAVSRGPRPRRRPIPRRPSPLAPSTLGAEHKTPFSPGGRPISRPRGADRAAPSYGVERQSQPAVKTAADRR